MSSKRPFLTALLLLFCFAAAAKTDSTGVFRGCDGGMMIHTGVLGGEIPQIGYRAGGAPVGIGGVARVHLWKHWRFGGEGYMSTLSQMGNDSYIKWGWGGVLADWYYELGRFIPYVGLTLGGGARTTCLIFEPGRSEWSPEEKVVFHKQGFFAVDPYIGCDYAVSNSFHLTLKADFLCCISDSQLLQPVGPRFYFGFIFYH